jgi:tripartite motif-containing protein 71
MYEMHYMKIKTVLIATVVTFALILMGSVIGNAVGSTQQGNNPYSLIAIWGSQGAGDGQFNSTPDLAVDSSDNVYVVERLNYRVQKFDSNGNFITKWGSEGDGEGQFDIPEGIDVDSSGNVYVADTHNSRMQKFAVVE